MSNFNVQNMEHVFALANVASEFKNFGAISHKSQAAAESLGLVPDDLGLLLQELDNVEGMQALKDAGDPASEVEGFDAALEAGLTMAKRVSVADYGIQALGQLDLLGFNQEGELVYNEKAFTPEGRQAVMVIAAALAMVDAQMNEDNEEDYEGSPEGSDIFLQEEQEEGHDGAGDVSVSASRAA